MAPALATSGAGGGGPQAWAVELLTASACSEAKAGVLTVNSGRTGAHLGIGAVVLACAVPPAQAQGPIIEPDLQGAALASYRMAAGLEREGKSNEAAAEWDKLLAMQIPRHVAWQVRNGLMPVDVRQITRDACAYPCISPDGRRLIQGSSYLRLQELAEPRSSRPVPLLGLANAGCPDWSPDGSLIAVQTITDQGHTVSVWEWAVEGPLGLLERDIPALYPRFSPDGTWLLLSAMPRFGIVMRDLLGGGDQPVPWVLALGARNHANWWADGKSIVFHAYMAEEPEDRALYRIGGTDPEKITTLVDDGKFNCLPAPSPLGNAVAYYYTTTSHTEGIVCLVSGEGDHRVELCEGITPRWSPDGRHLVFRGNNRRGYLMQMGGKREFPVGVRLAAGKEAAAITLTGGAETAEATIWTALYGPDGIAAVQYPWSEEVQVVPAGEPVDVLIPLEAAVGAGTYVVKATVEVAGLEGEREVRLVDWVAEG